MSDDPTVDPLTTLTPAWSLPYPASSDPVSLGATNIRDLAVAVDNGLAYLNSLLTMRDPHTIQRYDGVAGSGGAPVNCGPALVPPPGAGPYLVSMHMLLNVPENYPAKMLLYTYPAGSLIVQVNCIDGGANAGNNKGVDWEVVLYFGAGEYPVMMFAYDGPAGNPAYCSYRGFTMTYGGVSHPGSLLRGAVGGPFDPLELPGGPNYKGTYPYNPGAVDIGALPAPPPADEVAAAHGIILP
jgi:hypothetical protein